MAAAPSLLTREAGLMGVSKNAVAHQFGLMLIIASMRTLTLRLLADFELLAS